eukprot:TRINITY_DN10766_c0_g1_i2.p1 TRINITY_DN10766_c0_g1~~TRINITY_DN10766_c0_g1_i2.p1  ORF type:complete len:390 (+),score=91.60 TRINITY_DN10766_c0_g1_i2:289-1458(+)
MGLHFSPDFLETVDDAIKRIKQNHPNTVGVVRDLFLGNTAHCPSSQGLKSCYLWTSGYLSYAVLALGGTQLGDGTMEVEYAPGRFISICGSDWPDMEQDFVKLCHDAMSASDGVILSASAIGWEGFIRSAVSKKDQKDHPLLKVPTFLIGPQLPDWFIDHDETVRSQHLQSQLAGSNPSSKRCLEFLEKQNPNSVLYISLGSNCSFTMDQAKSLTNLLDRMQVPFLMVHHPHDGADIAAEVDQLGNQTKGCVVDWAPQLEVLAHPSVRCFLSHLGFGSTLESIIAEKPMIAAPIRAEQNVNAQLMQCMELSLGQIAINSRVPTMIHDGHPVMIPLKDVEKTIAHAMFSDGENKVKERANNLHQLYNQIIDGRSSGQTRMEMAKLVQCLR